jgi:SecD/SecF fusion protein
VAVEFTGAAARSWERLTAQAACAAPGDPLRRIAIVLDDKIISSPQVEPETRCGVGMIGDRIQITGQFTQAEARELALLINAGALPVPVPVDIVEQRTVGPTLGAAAIENSARAAVIGVALIVGVLAALFTTLVLTRVLLHLAARAAG